MRTSDSVCLSVCLSVCVIALSGAFSPCQAVSALSVLERPCSVNVVNADPNELLLRLLENTGVKIIAPHLTGEVTITEEKTPIKNILSHVLRARGYCCYTLGYRLFVHRNPTFLRVSQGTGYIKNITTGCVVVFDPLVRPAYVPPRNTKASRSSDDMMYVDVVEEGWYVEQTTVVGW